MRLKIKDSGQKIFILFLILWGILNLLQAFLTPLHNDEAYYWMYSRYPAWGYFDHPPMIAMMIKAGYALLHNEAGVRLLVVVGQITTMVIIWNLLDGIKKTDRQAVLILVLVISMLPVLNIYGFMAMPDSPLLLFTALFLLIYRRFLNEESWFNIFALGITMAGLMYSKYHGAIMLLLVILSNPGLLKKPGFYIAAAFAIILFTPHIFWQFSNGFPSVKYHLADRVAGFELKNVPEYLGNQLLIHNPLLLPLLLFVIFKVKTRDLFEKTLKYIIAGFFIFFFVASFRYKVQPQWTALITIPVVILFFNNFRFSQSLSLYLKRAAMVLVPMILFVRASLMFDFLPVSFLKKEFHENRKRAAEVEAIAGERPVVFTNSYQDPSLYTFYTGKFAHSLNNKNYRKTQFDLWHFEEQIHGKEILYLPHWLDDYYKELLTTHITDEGDTLYYRIFHDFQSLQRECVLQLEESYNFKISADNKIELDIFNPYDYAISTRHPEFPVIFQAAFCRPDGILELKKNLEFVPQISDIAPRDTIRVTGNFRIDELPEGEYNFVICTETGILYDAYSSRFVKASVTR